MRAVVALAVLTLAACSTPAPMPTHVASHNTYQNTELIVDREITMLTRNEVINSVKECEESGLRPVMITARRRINGFLSTVPVDVTCAPRYGK
tara:strand:+ start:17 stop:295 length:279 start_codon:yes stop_codon:yes gene_type:complete